TLGNEAVGQIKCEGLRQPLQTAEFDGSRYLGLLELADGAAVEFEERGHLRAGEIELFSEPIEASRGNLMPWRPLSETAFCTVKSANNCFLYVLNCPFSVDALTVCSVEGFY